MHTLQIVGMGPGSMAYLTMSVHELLTTAERVYLRTAKHPVVEKLVENGMQYTSYDAFYESAETFEETYSRIVEDVVSRLKDGPVVYAVPGNPFVAEETVRLLMAQSEVQGFPVTVHHGASFLDAMITTLGFDPVEGLVVRDALKVETNQITDKTDHIWIQVYSPQVASELKLQLMTCFDDEHEVTIIRAAGIPDLEVVETVPLCEMDRHGTLFDHLTSVYVKKASTPRRDLWDLIDIMAKLRGENGCPWDREQTHESLTRYLIEEAYEVKQAVENGDDEELVDELGDVLLQVIFHAQLGDEEGYFNWRDIVDAICEKMVRRHPHVFSDVSVRDSAEVLTNWQAIKNKEKKHTRVSESMRGLPMSLPALMRAQKVQKRASDVGFDWQDVKKAVEKITEEVDEVSHALEHSHSAHVFEELGDLLLIVTNVIRMLGGDAELIMNEAVDKFVKRFEFVEKSMEEAGIEMNFNQLDAMERFWQAAKSKKHDKSE